jgi:hypothetical protein
MLIEFSVANFGSFRERQTLSMVAAPRLGRKENTFTPQLDEKRFPALLKVAAVYGANASGKSTLVRALQAIRYIVHLEPKASPQPLPLDPFRFDPQCIGSPSSFELHFIAEGQRYEFKLAATKDRIEEESLVVFPHGKETLLYRRLGGPERENYEFGSALEGGSSLHETWRKLTPPRVLFLSRAVANSNQDLRQLRIPFNWLTHGLRTVANNNSLRSLAEMTRDMLRRHPAVRSDLLSFIRDLDIPVTGLKFDELPQGRSTEDPKTARDPIAASLKLKATLTHKTALGEASFDFDEESSGTQNLMGLFALWLMFDPPLEFSQQLRVLVFDELDSSLHPKIVDELVRRHLKDEGRGQLIFTTHNTHLMNARLLRRDQIWLTERDMNGATRMRSVHEFEGREGEDLEKRYYEGRYRGLPIIRAK